MGVWTQLEVPQLCVVETITVGNLNAVHIYEFITDPCKTCMPNAECLYLFLWSTTVVKWYVKALP